MSTQSSDSERLDDVDAVVVNYNAGIHLQACVTSLSEAGVGRIVVVDNMSTDGSMAALMQSSPGVVQISAGGNLGYGKAANMAAATCGSEWLMVCNPDVVIHPGAISRLRDRLILESDLGVVGPRLINMDGTVYPSARAFPSLVDAVGHGLVGQLLPSNRWTRRYKLLDVDSTVARDTDWVSGACFLIRRKLWDAIGGFDPSFFMYMEDVDLCWRAREAGWRVAFEPSARVVHVQGVSAESHPYRMLTAHHRSMWQFALRTSRGADRIMLPIVGVGLAARLVVSVARRALA